MTLLEVVAGLALLASLLGALVLAKARYARQAAAADRRLEAVDAADDLLAAWHRDPKSLPHDGYGSGTVPGDSRLAWRTRPVANGGVEELGGRAVRLEVLDRRTHPPPVLVGVEFVVAQAPESGKPPATRPARAKEKAK
jgi:hypothetical protein